MVPDGVVSIWWHLAADLTGVEARRWVARDCFLGQLGYRRVPIKSERERAQASATRGVNAPDREGSSRRASLRRDSEDGPDECEGVAGNEPGHCEPNGCHRDRETGRPAQFQTNLFCNGHVCGANSAVCTSKLSIYCHKLPIQREREGLADLGPACGPAFYCGRVPANMQPARGDACRQSLIQPRLESVAEQLCSCRGDTLYIAFRSGVAGWIDAGNHQLAVP